MIDVLMVLLLLVLIVTAFSIFVFNDLLYIVIIFGAYSMVMSLIWQQLNSPDLAITEAAVGIGMTVLMVTVVTKVGRRPE
ncbi:MAG: hydrogenase subunit MbhD domain-containing protein [Bacillota bacterium]|jgi:energy-converting hydrogenase B subunit D|nr:hydrogenase subunit MbhD domain-containing protein [Bacillota bacterium]